MVTSLHRKRQPWVAQPKLALISFILSLIIWVWVQHELALPTDDSNDCVDAADSCLP